MQVLVYLSPRLPGGFSLEIAAARLLKFDGGIAENRSTAYAVLHIHPPTFK